MAIHGQCPTRRKLVGVSRPYDQRGRPAHFFVQEAHGIAEGIIGSKGIGTHQLGQAIGLVGRRHVLGPHFVQNHRGPCLRGLPGGLRTCEPPANDVKFCHGCGFSSSPVGRKPWSVISGSALWHSCSHMQQIGHAVRISWPYFAGFLPLSADEAEQAVLEELGCDGKLGSRPWAKAFRQQSKKEFRKPWKVG